MYSVFSLLERRLRRALVITQCPSSVCPSFNFSHFDFSSEIAEQKLWKRYRKEELNVLYQVCGFWANRKTKMAALAPDGPRHF